ncbi:MAG TPA: CopG family antitoxin [Thermoanaerobaculia bacterium]
MSFRLKEIPEFQSEEEEREFWRTHDSADYIDLSKLETAAFPNLRPTGQAQEE